jgi:Spy/CpxP family protein refolding chaperone
MRTLCKAALTVAVVALVAGPALAQRPGGGGFGGFGQGPASLLNNKSVQEELKLTPDQVEKLSAPGKKLGEKMREINAGGFQNLTDEERQERRKKTEEASKAANDEALKLAKDTLKEDQVKRLHQIELQVKGTAAFSDEAVQSALKLTDEQKQDIKKIQEESRKAMGELFQPGGGGNREENQKKMQTLRKETQEKIAGLLTADQKKAWKDMTGEPFEIKFEAPRRRQQQ